ncbi:MAG TPA: PIN domain-containing protein [Verrucomicrobiae bacterium]|nr:PIN domain-containing protein [Verrucomicrobiae bacterium]
MRWFLDTNVLIAACLEEHEHHGRALPVLQEIHRGKAQGATSAHALLEIYSTLTRLPRSPRMLATQVTTLIQENILNRMCTVTLSSKEYAQLVLRLGNEAKTGGAAYDALHLACARKWAADRIYTFNLSHFQRVAPLEIKPRIVSP